jgi:hypothetical protein
MLRTGGAAPFNAIPVEPCPPMDLRVRREGWRGGEPMQRSKHSWMADEQAELAPDSNRGQGQRTGGSNDRPNNMR